VVLENRKSKGLLDILEEISEKESFKRSRASKFVRMGTNALEK